MGQDRHEPSRIPELIDIAFKTALSGSPGPTFLEFPVDVLDPERPAGSVRFLDSPSPLRSMGDPAGRQGRGGPHRWGQAPDHHRRKRRPVFGRRRKPVKRLVEETGMPLFTLSMGRGTLPEDHPLCFGSALVIRPGRPGPPSPPPTSLSFWAPGSTSSRCSATSSRKTRRSSTSTSTPSRSARNRNVDTGDHRRRRARRRPAHRGARRDGSRRTPLAGWVAELTEQRKFSLDSVAESLTSENVPIHPQRLVTEIDEFMGRTGSSSPTAGTPPSGWA